MSLAFFLALGMDAVMKHAGAELAGLQARSAAGWLDGWYLFGQRREGCDGLDVIRCWKGLMGWIVGEQKETVAPSLVIMVGAGIEHVRMLETVQKVGKVWVLRKMWWRRVEG